MLVGYILKYNTFLQMRIKGLRLFLISCILYFMAYIMLVLDFWTFSPEMPGQLELSWHYLG